MAKLGNAPGWDKVPRGSPNPGTCQMCGKPLKDPKFTLCYDCNQKAKGNPLGQTQIVPLPQGCRFQTFYDSGGHLRREIFIEAARDAAEVFMKAKISQTSIRNLFNLLKDMANRLQADRQLDFGIARETYYKFIRQIEYNAKREVLNPIFLEFAEHHLNVATKDKKEFLGFVEYLTSIVARLKSK